MVCSLIKGDHCIDESILSSSPTAAIYRFV